jgi:hypothetical protein
VNQSWTVRESLELAYARKWLVSVSMMDGEQLLTFPRLLEWRIEGTCFLMDGSWDCLSIDLSFFLAKDDVELCVICALEADNFTSAWCINEFAELASR